MKITLKGKISAALFAGLISIITISYIVINIVLNNNLEDYITFDDNEYKICAYGCLQCQFNDDRDRSLGSDELER